MKDFKFYSISTGPLNEIEFKGKIRYTQSIIPGSTQVPGSWIAITEEEKDKLYKGIRRDWSKELTIYKFIKSNG